MSLIKANGAGDQDTGFYNGVATQSLRFDSEDTAYLYRTNSSNSNKRKFTWSGWLKKSVVFTSTATANQTIVLGGGASNTDPNDSLYFDAQAVGSLNMNRLSSYYYMGNASGYVDYSEETTRVFEDPSAWFHVVLAVDTTQSTASNRIRYYINGTEQTSKTQYYGQVPQNTDLSINDNVLQNIGRSINIGDSRTFNGYMAEINFVDGFQYDPSYFGETKNGIWIAKKYTGSYGTNGYRLNFKSTDLNVSGGAVSDPRGSGTNLPNNSIADASGQGNHWTISGVGAEDFVEDSPENNFATLNSFIKAHTALTYLKGNLKITRGSVDAYSLAMSTLAVKTGKWYAELRPQGTITSGNHMVGVCVTNVKDQSSGDPYLQNGQINYVALGNGHVDDGGSINASTFSGSTSFGAGDIVGVALDLDSSTRTVKFYKNNSLVNTSSYGNLSSEFDDEHIGFMSIFFGTNTCMWNFGQDSTFAGQISAGGNADGNGIGDFAYSPPSGHLALCTANFSDDNFATIGPSSATRGIDHFGTLTYTSDGNAVNIVSGANDNNGTAIGGEINFSPDWVWIKRRNASNNHQVFDTIRGTNVLVPNENGNQSDYSSYFAFLSSSNGFRLPAASANMNANGGTYVAWNWLAGGGSSVTNNDGSIASTVSANTTAGFSIVKATSPSSGTWTVGHGLGATPTFVIQKYLASNSRWTVFHNTLTSGQYLGLNESNAVASSGTPFNFTFNSTVIGGNSNYDATSTDVIYYVFRDIEGFSKIGTYTGNGDVNGAFVYTGFRPAFLLYKSTGSGNWLIDDDVTQTFNPDSNYLVADTADLEGDTTTNTAGHVFDILSNGFKMRNTNSARNADGSTYIYLAFARAPFKFANAR